MSQKSLRSKSRRPIGRQTATLRRAGKAPAAGDSAASPLGGDLALPHERDESINATALAPDPVTAQAKRDIDRGLVDRDMRATPGLDAPLRAKLVPGPGGQPPGDEDKDMTQTAVQPATAELPTLAEQKADFTAEGAPPPGKVSTSAPQTPQDDSRKKPAPPAPDRAGKQIPTSANPRLRPPTRQ